jgi:hypothetical protein
MKGFLPLAASLALGALVVPASAAFAQAAAESSPQRDAAREQLRSTLAAGGARSDVGVTFRQSAKNPYNFVGTMTAGLANSDSLELVVGASTNQTISVRVYPHYKGGYINIRRARDAAGLMTKLLVYNSENFLYWGADDAGDVFAGYTFTLESGFPSEAIVVVLRSLRVQDKFVGEMRPLIDGTSPPAK